MPVTPKQHILDAHCADFVKQWRFVLVFHGEQGGESCHATVSLLKRRAWGFQNEEDKLRLIMKEQLTLASSSLQSHVRRKNKRTMKTL